MPVNAEGVWLPDASPKQFQIMRVARKPDGQRKFFLVSGPRWSSKSIGCLHACVDHAWNTPNAVVNVLVPTITAGSDSGIWTLLTEQIIPEWIAGDFGLEWAPRGSPRQHGVTKKFFCVIKNKFGGKSRFELNSLKDERKVETDFKNRYFSMIYWSELSSFKFRKTFDTLIQTLRIKGVAEDQHILLADTNPADEGKDSWIYKLWYETRIALPETLRAEERPMQKNLQLLEVFIDDNPYLTDERKESLKASFAHDPDLFDRYVLGKWTKSSSDALFAGTFRPSVHIIGNNDDDDPEILVPEDDCIELITSWDPGGVNPAAVIAEKIFVPERDLLSYDNDKVIKEADAEVLKRLEETTEGKTVEEKELAVFKFLDELVFTDSDLSIGEFTELFCEVMDFWEAYIGKPVRWRHWSDRQAFDQKESISKRYVYQEVFAASGGRIVLEAVEKGRGSVPQGVRMWRKLLFQNRLLFSARKTPKLIEMNRALRRGKNLPDTVYDQDPLRHVFDAGRYLVTRECWEEMLTNIMTMKTIKSGNKLGLISVRL